jgi:hypothetical protein
VASKEFAGVLAIPEHAELDAEKIRRGVRRSSTKSEASCRRES